MKLKSALPKGESDGVSNLEGSVLKKSNPIVAVVILEEHSRTQAHDTKEWEITLRIRRIEPLLTEDVEAATRLLQRSFESRTGESTLPIELEDDIKDALKGVGLFVPETQPTEEAFTGQYSDLTIPKLTKLLRDRKLDASKGTKTELIGRLEWADANPLNSPTTNVTNLFSDGSAPPVDEVDEVVDVPVEDVDPESVYMPDDSDAPDPYEGLSDEEIDQRAQAAMDLTDGPEES